MYVKGVRSWTDHQHSTAAVATYPRRPVIPKEGRGTDDGRDTLNKRTKWAEVLMPIAVVTMCVCCGRRGKEAKKEAADFLGSFPPHYVSSVAEKMTRGGDGGGLRSEH